MSWGKSDENGLECRTEELEGKVLFYSWVVMAVSLWGAVSRSRCKTSGAVGQEHSVLGQCGWRRDTSTAPACSMPAGQGITWMTWEQAFPSPQHWLSGENVREQKMSSLLYLSKLLCQNDSECRKSSRNCAQISGALAGAPMVQVACHGQSTRRPMPGHLLVLPGWRMLPVPCCLGR